MRAQIGKVQREILKCLNTKYPMPVNLVIEDVIESSDKLVTKANLLRTMRSLVILQYMAETAEGLLLTPSGREYLKIDQIRQKQRREAI